MDPIQPGPADPSTLSLALLQRVNASCEQFESAWRAGSPVQIEDLLEGWSEPGRSALAAELIALETELRHDRGERPDRSEYMDRFPELALVVQSTFASMETYARVNDEDTSAPKPGHSSFEGHLPEFGDYVLLEEIARGGMGVVFRARQKRLNRIVALKMILSGQFASANEMLRFRHEAELAANLDHPNIVPIYEVGEHDGHHYFSMKLVDGGSLASQARRVAENPQVAARIVGTVARAIHYAHRQGFVHCDLKPSNILLDAAGMPQVTDFGLARRVAGDSALTASGAILGTPSYMAPEQASGQRGDLTPAADVYGLGAILYELLTGRPPFRAATVMETVVQVLEREPAPPRELRQSVPPELESICLKCLEKSPRDRYASALELAESLDQYLRGEAIAGTSPLRRLRRWTRREPELVSRLGGLTLIAALTQYNYLRSLDPDPSAHYRIQAEFALWALTSIVFQLLLRRGRRTELVKYAWAATDVVALTSVLFLVEAFGIDTVVGYPLLIAASGLWFRVPLVWFTTAMACAGYAVLWLITSILHDRIEARSHLNIVMAALLVTGFVVARQVKRIWALSTYYENRPAQ